MKKNFLKITGLTLSLLFAGITTTSCSFIGDDPYSIQNVDQYFDQDGNKWIKILFTDEDIPPVEVQIPKGEKGDIGNGIKNVTSSIVEGAVEITLYYTDSETKPEVIRVPIRNGKDGVGIENFTADLDEETGSRHIKITFTDNRKPIEFDIEKGEKGNGIKNISKGVYNEETGETDFTIFLEDGTSQVISVPKGDTGRGIYAIDFEETENEYVFVIIYTDTEEERITCPKPKSSVWYYGEEAPAIEIGKIGDFFFCKGDGTIWAKSPDPDFVPSDDPFNPTFDKGIWKLLFKLEGTSKKEQHVVKFNAQGGTVFGEADGKFMIAVDHGSTIPNNMIPIPEKEGFTFDGWFSDIEIGPLTGKLTYTTPITHDWTFYAHYTSK